MRLNELNVEQCSVLNEKWKWCKRNAGKVKCVLSALGGGSGNGWGLLAWQALPGSGRGCRQVVSLWITPGYYNLGVCEALSGLSVGK